MEAIMAEHGDYEKTQLWSNGKAMSNALAYFRKSILFDSKNNPNDRFGFNTFLIIFALDKNADIRNKIKCNP